MHNISHYYLVFIGEILCCCVVDMSVFSVYFSWTFLRALIRINNKIRPRPTSDR